MSTHLGKAGKGTSHPARLPRFEVSPVLFARKDQLANRPAPSPVDQVIGMWMTSFSRERSSSLPKWKGAQSLLQAPGNVRVGGMCALPSSWVPHPQPHTSTLFHATVPLNGGL